MTDESAPHADWFEPGSLFARGYPASLSSSIRDFPELFEELRRTVAGLGAARVLEIGPGDRPLVVEGSFVVYLDAAAAFLRSVRRPVLGDLRRAPFLDRAFDLVVAADVFTHIPPLDRPGAVAELVRLAPRILIVNPEAGPRSVAGSRASTDAIEAQLADMGLEIDRCDLAAPDPAGDYSIGVILALAPG
jgi:hypothetical protein